MLSLAMHGHGDGPQQSPRHWGLKPTDKASDKTRAPSICSRPGIWNAHETRLHTVHGTSGTSEESMWNL